MAGQAEVLSDRSWAFSPLDSATCHCESEPASVRSVSDGDGPSACRDEGLKSQPDRPRSVGHADLKDRSA